MRMAVTGAEQLYDAGLRLDASYHASEGVKALRFIRKWAGVPEPEGSPSLRDGRRIAYGTRRLEPLEEVCVPNGVFIPSRFRRIFVDDSEHGAPYLTGGSIMQADPLVGAKRLSYRFTSNMDELALKERMTLVTCSGTIGNTVYVNANFVGAVGSPDLLRIVADPCQILPGYLYAFLGSPLGRALIKQKTYGAVVPHIEAHHVLDLPIPRLDAATEQRIHDLVERAAALRVEALRLQGDARQLASASLGVDLSQLATVRLQVIPISRLDQRLEATYHAAREVAYAAFRFCRVPMAHVGDLMLDMFYLGKLHRVFVSDGDHGVPLLSIADAQKSTLMSEKFVSKVLSRNVNRAILRQGYVLVSRVGTPGLVTYVRREMAGMAGTDHLVRLVCDESKILPGYLYSILSSPMGYALLVGSAHGSVQLVLPPEYIAHVAIPLLPLAEQRPIHELIERYGEALTGASESEAEAQALLADALGYTK